MGKTAPLSSLKVSALSAGIGGVELGLSRRDFWTVHADAEQPLRAWYQEAVASAWLTPNGIIQRYHTADIIPGNRVVFNIKNNDCRLIVKIHYNTGTVYVRFVGTHREYDKVDAKTI